MNTSSLPLNRARRSAFSLIEVAFALVIFVIGAIAILRIFPTGLNVLENSGNRRIGTRIADEYIARSTEEGAANAPQAVYNAEFGSSKWNWTDFPGSMASTKTSALSMPKALDGVNDSALGNIRYVRGRRVPVDKPYGGGGSLVVMPDMADRRQAFVSREGFVKGVSINSSGEMDFSAATYERTDVGTVPKDYPFHEPTVGDQNVRSFTRPAVDASSASTITFPMTMGSAVADANLPNYCTRGNTNISGSPKPSVWVRAVPATTYGVPASSSAIEGTDYSFDASSTLSTSSGQQFTFTTPSISFNITILNPAPGATDNKYFYLELHDGRGVSVLYSRVLVGIQGSAGNPLVDPATTPAPAKCAVRPPWWMRVSRNQPMTYYVSYQYTDGGIKSGISNEPLVFPGDDTGYPQSCDTSYGAGTPGRVLAAYRGITTFDATNTASVRFRQPIQNYEQIWYSTLFLDGGDLLDVTNRYSPNDMTYALLDYSVRGWDFFNDISTGGTPSTPSGALASPPTNSDYDWISLIFLYPQYNTVPENLREYRTPFGNLQNPLATTVYWKWGDGSLIGTFNSPLSNVGDARWKAASAKFAKEGRFFYPVSYFQNANFPCPATEPTNTSGSCPASLATPFPQTTIAVTYRSKDGWTRQLGVVADRYMPYVPASAFTLPAGVTRVSEPWREYVIASGKLYFHAPEAGKTVAVKFASGTIKNFELDDDLVSATALGAANSGFVDAVSNPQGKVAVSLETLPAADSIIDVGSPDTINNVPANSVRDGSGSGVIVRTAWQNGVSYSSTYAASGNVSR